MAFETAIVYDPLKLNFTDTLIGDGVMEPTNWKRGPFIGGGGFGQVYHMTVNDKDTTVQLAVKQLFVTHSNQEEGLDAIKREIHILSKLKHERIVPYFGYCKKDNVLFLFMEMMSMGSLFKYIRNKNNPAFSEQKIVHITKQILEGLVYLHSTGIIHRDIKAANVLLEDTFNIKLADFGVSKQLENISVATTQNMGTMRWRAPEMFNLEPYGKKVDIWALGCTILEMITRTYPFEGYEDPGVFSRLSGHNPSPAYGINLNCSPELQEFLNETFKDDPRERPSAIELQGNKIFLDLKNDEESTSSIHTPDLIKTEESKLQRFYFGCKKNPGHVKFIPINEFNIRHLPKEYQNIDIVDFVRSIADLTVRVFTSITSTKRPEFWPDTEQPYAFYGIHGTGILRVGSGIVYKATMHTSEKCLCHKCKLSDKPSDTWGEIWVVTATHVFFDELEAQNTSCRFFFDSQDSPHVTCDGFTVVNADVISDRCVMKHETCDVDLLNKIDIKLRQSEVIRSGLMARYWNTRDENKLCIITAHPHGYPKQVCVGR